MSASSMGQAALELSRMRLAVFPLKPGKKEPATRHGCKDAALIDAEDAEQWGDHNIGVATGSISGVVVIDIDVDEDSGKDGYRWMRQWELEHGPLPETWSVCTPRGGMHYYFAYSGSDIRNSTDEDKAVDIRGEGGYVVAPPSVAAHGSYVWEVAPEDVPLAPVDIHVMDFIRAVQGKAPGKKFELPAAITSGARNDTLFKLASSLQSKGTDDDSILAQLIGVNKMRCKPPLSDEDITKIWASVVHRYDKGTQKAEPEQAEQEVHVVRICGVPSVWDGSRYRTGIRAIDKVVYGAYPGRSRSKRRDIREDLLTIADDVEQAHPRYIAFTNGVVDIEDAGASLLPYDRNMHIVNVIPHEFDVNAKCPDVDKFLDDVSCGDQETRQAILDTVGLCLHRSSMYGMVPILLGKGANGKSTFMRALRNVLGKENTSSLDLRIVGERFQEASMMGKLANIGDDIASDFIGAAACSEVRKIATGEKIYTDIKGSDPIEFDPYVTLVFSANEMPGMADTTDGMMRRLMPVEFKANFYGKERDPHMSEKLCTEEAARYWALLGVMALYMINKRGGVVVTDRMASLVEGIRTDNSSILQWIDDREITAETLVGKDTSIIYRSYMDWCANSGAKAFGKRKFSRFLYTIWSLKSVPKGKDADRKTIRIYELETKNG